MSNERQLLWDIRIEARPVQAGEQSTMLYYELWIAKAVHGIRMIMYNDCIYLMCTIKLDICEPYRIV